VKKDRPTIDEGFTILDILDQAKTLEAIGSTEMSDDELLMSETTWKQLTSVLLGTEYEDEVVVPAGLFGLPVVIENLLQDGVVHRRPRTKEER